MKTTCQECGSKIDPLLAACSRCGTPCNQLKQSDLIDTVLAERYRIVSFIGEGGMGVVYKGTCLKTGRNLAIKLMHPHLAGDTYSRKRFEQEASAASCLLHPNLIAVHDFGMTPSGQPYMVQDYLEGVSLEDVIEKSGPQTVKRTADIFSQVCDALAQAHRRGVIHRDIKPSNIMLLEIAGRKDFVKVVDFGIAKLLPQSGLQSQHLTADGETFGSPLYMSPEQCLAQKLDPRSDIYSLGCVIYETLTGKPPIVGESMLDTMQKHVTDSARPMKSLRPELSEYDRLESVISRSIAKDPALRQQSMQQLKEELLEATTAAPAANVAGIAAPHVVTAVPASGKEAAPQDRFKRHHMLLLLTMLLILTAAIYILIQQAKDVVWLDNYYDDMMDRLVRIQRKL